MTQRSSTPPPASDAQLVETESAIDRARATVSTNVPTTAPAPAGQVGLSEDALTRLGEETHRLTMRFIDEVVVAFDLCPWARPALVAKEVQIRPILQDFRGSDGALHAATRVHDELNRVAPSAVLVLVVLPLLAIDRLAMDALLRLVRTTPSSGASDVVTSVPAVVDREPSFALAAFHPDAVADLTSPARLVPFLRRSPYPLVQAVRTETLTRIDAGRRSGTENLGAHVVAEVARYRATGKPQPIAPRERIAVANHAHVENLGPDVIERVLADIFRDRDETHRRLGIA